MQSDSTSQNHLARRDRTAMILLVCVPVVLMIGVAAAAIGCVGSAALLGIGLTCIPYLVLAASARAVCRRTSHAQDALWFVVPAIAIALFHAAVILSHLNHVAAIAARPRGAWPVFLSPEELTSARLSVSGLGLSVVAIVWRFVVRAIVAVRAKVRRRPGECRVCHYDRTGLPTAAPCPECGDLLPPVS